MTKKVLILVPDLKKPGGVTNYFLALEGEFKRWEADYFVRGSRNSTPKLLIPVLLVVDYFRFFFKVLFSDYDLIHVNVSLRTNNLVRDPMFITLAKLLNKKVLLFMHGWDVEKEGKFKNWPMRQLVKADGIVVLAKAYKEAVKKWGFKGEIFVRPTVVSRAIEEGVSEDYVIERSAQDPIRLLFLSRVEQKKGIILTIRAFQILLEKYPSLQLDIAGDGGALNEAKELVINEAIPNVTFYGYIGGDEKRDILRNAHINFLPTSFNEGMPISILEAMMAGQVLVTRPMGGINDIFTPDMGFATESLDPKVYAENVEIWINNREKLKKICLHNYHYAREHFTVKATQESLENIYDIVSKA